MTLIRNGKNETLISHLLFTFRTLDRYSITADALIHFTPMHKTLRIQLPDLRYIDSNVDFSTKTFDTVIAVCSELGRNADDGDGHSQGCQMAKFDPFLSLDCARVEGVGAQSKERKGSNFSAWRSRAIVQKPKGPNT